MTSVRSIWAPALVALALMLPVGPTVASAEEFHFSTEPTSLVGTQEGSHKFTIEGSTVTCAKAELTGDAPTKTKETQALHPEYSGCTAFGFPNATVDTEGCELDFNANSTTMNLKNCTKGYMTINVTSLFNTRCHVTIPDSTTGGKNSAVNGVSFENMTPMYTFTMFFTSTNVHYTVDVSTGLCPLASTVSGPVTGTTAKYEGRSVLKGNSGTTEITKF